jgi:hypothetical protein
MNVLNATWKSGYDIDGLNPEDQIRVAAIGLSAWMDEIAAKSSKPSRYSLAAKQRRMRKGLTK